MCNRYEYEGTFESIATHYEAKAIGSMDAEGSTRLVFPRYLAPGLIRNSSGKRELHPVQFAFSTPGMSTPYHPKKNRNNARIEEVDNPRSAWMKSFQEHRCILPMTAFHEPCYWGETEKTKVYFERPDRKLLHGAAIYREWIPPEGGTPLITVSLLIGPARPYVMEHGHERQPIFVDESGFDGWLSSKQMATEDAKQILREHFADPELTFRTESPLSDSTWKRQQKKRLADRDSQLAALGRQDNLCGF